jgi:hypothetical protein
MRGFFLAAVAALALTGCQSAEEKRAAETGEIDVANASTGQVSRLIKAASAKTAVKPGLWKAELHIEAVDVGTGGDSAAQLQMAKGLERNTTECRTAEQLKPFDIAKLEQVAGECSFAHYVAKGGKVDAEIHCKKGDAPETVILVNGTTSTIGFDVVTQNRTGTAGQPGYSLVRMRSTGARMGECKA